MSTQLEEFSKQFRKELLVKNAYVEDKGYSSNHKNALSDGDEKGKGENAGNVGSLTDINTRKDNMGRNYYNDEIGYSSTHPNALSDGDEKGKGETNTIGSITDINRRTDNVARNQYNANKGYPDF